MDVNAIGSLCVNVTISNSGAKLILVALLTEGMDVRRMDVTLTHFLASGDTDKKGIIL